MRYFRMNSKTIVLIIALCILSLLACTGCSSKEDEVPNLTLTLAGTAGTWYTQGASVAEYVNNNSSIIRITPMSSTGGVENMRTLNAGEQDFGLGYTGNIYDAWEGVGGHESDGKLQNIRMIGPFQKLNGLQFGVFADSEVKKISDFKGKTISTGPVGSSAQYYADLFLKHYGLYDEMDVQYYGWEELSTLMRDGELAGVSRFGAVIQPMFQEMSQIKPMRILDLSAEMKECNLFETFPFLYEHVTPAGTYPGHTEDAYSYGMPVVIVCNKDIPDEYIYELCKAIYTKEAADYVETAYRDHDLLNTEDPFPSLLIPLHPGAEKFWQEKGVSIPEPLLK